MKKININEEDYEWLKAISDEHDLYIEDVVGELIWRWQQEHKGEQLFTWG